MSKTIKEASFPVDVGGRMNSLLNVVNGELKSIALLHLERDHMYTEGELYTHIKRTLVPGYLPASRTFSQYCSSTLCPIGMVAKEEVISEGNVALSCGYGLTSAGQEYGLPVAAFALYWARKNKLSLFTILGPTLSGGKSRAPLSRARLLEALVQKDGQSASELGKTLDLCIGDIRGHAKSLQEQGFINFESVGKFTQWRDSMVYEYIEGSPAPQTVRTSPGQTIKVYEAMKKMKRANYLTIATEVSGNKSNVSVILSGLRDQGILQGGGQSYGEHQSSVRITPQGKYFVSDFLTPLRGALTDAEPLQALRENYLFPLTASTVNFNNACRDAASHYTTVSPYINRKDVESRVQGILEKMKCDKLNISASECAQSENLSVARAGILLNRMEKSGYLVSSLDGDKVKRYQLKTVD